LYWLFNKIAHESINLNVLKFAGSFQTQSYVTQSGGTFT